MFDQKNNILKFICKDYEVAAILFGGSRTLRMNNEDSDCDLTVLLEPASAAKVKSIEADLYCNQVAEYIKCGNTVVHWYYTHPDCNKNNFYHFDLWAIEAVFGYEKYNNILYLQNPNTLKAYFSSIKQYLPTALDNCLKTYADLFDNIINSDVAACGYEITKEVYHLCTINILLKNGLITAQDKIFLQSVKSYAKKNNTIVSKRKQNKYDQKIIKMVQENMKELLKNAEAYKIIYQETKGTL